MSRGSRLFLRLWMPHACSRRCIKPFHSGRPATSRRIVAPLGCQEPMARGRMNRVWLGECFPTLAVVTGLFSTSDISVAIQAWTLSSCGSCPGEGKIGASGAQPSDAAGAARTTAVQSPGANFRLVARVAALFLRAGMEGTGRDFKIPAKARRCCLIF